MGEASRSSLERVQLTAIAVAVFALPLLMWLGLTDYNYTKSIASLILISVLLVLWGFTAWRRSSWKIHVPWVLVPVAGFVLAGVLSLLQATNVRVIIQSLILFTYFVLLLWMIANVVRDQRDTQWILAAAFASAILAALYGVLQYFGIVPGVPGATGARAVISFMGNRNHLGGFLLYMFYPAIILLVRAKALWAKALTVIGIALLFAVLLLVEQTATRVAFILVTAALAVGCLIFRPVKPLRNNRWWLLGLAGAVVAMCVYTAILTPVESPIGMWENNSGRARAWFWLIGAEMLADHPVTGVGLGNYKLDFFLYKADFATTERGQNFDFSIHRVSHAHNEYIQTGAELGVIGLFMLLCCLGALAISLWIRLRRSNEKNRLDLLLLTGGILTFLAHSVVSFPAHIASSSLLLAVFCGLALSPRYGRSALTFHWELTGWKARTFHIGFVVIALIVSSFAIADLRANWLMERGLDQIQVGLYAMGEETLTKSLSIDFAPRQTYYYLAIAQIQQGNYEEAEKNLETCMTSFIDERVYLTYADLELKRGELENAQAAVDLLLATHLSEEVERQVLYIEAAICIERQQFDRAYQLLLSLTLDHPTFEPGLVALGQLCAAQGLTNSACRYFEEALQLIEKKLEATYANSETAPLAKAKLIRDEIETLTRQRDHVVNQLNDLR